MAPVPPTCERTRQDSPERGTRTRHRKRMLSDEAYDRPSQIHQRQRLADLSHRVTQLASITGYLAEQLAASLFKADGRAFHSLPTSCRPSARNSPRLAAKGVDLRLILTTAQATAASPATA